MRIQLKNSLLSVLVLGLILHVLSAKAQNVDEIFSKHISAMGGEKYTGLKSVKIEATAQVMGMDLPSTTTIMQGRGLRSETTVQGMAIVQGIDGNSGWMINPMTGQTGAVALPEEQVKMSAGQLDLTGLYQYKEKGHTAEYVGEETLEGAAVYVVKVTMANGGIATHYISKDTYYILKSAVKVSVQGQDVEVKSSFSDFKQVDGVTFPFSSEIESPAMPGVMTMLVKSVQVNPSIDESIFAMPKN
ncbi:outer membrane lipoprotein-sorting protein [Arundinibacter roseus]|uniref:Outer membrane lipoprotein-sorting protein n=1 Tax=Arundinibacter roseus TaxID=2070510 RepID=A0A4V2XA16_9BACT|nr:outer membrane lipoprotein-sorting protein [Arundinibacter roseus]TDB65885.1 outer membrane lipoprotein-sorting protein [Arundinibacter roseus]